MPRARKPAKLKKFIKENSMTRTDLAYMIRNVLFNYSETELKDLLTDTTKPMIIRLLVKSYLADVKRGSLINFTTMLNRAYGQPSQDIKIEHGLEDVTKLTPEQRADKIRELLEKYNESKESE